MELYIRTTGHNHKQATASGEVQTYSDPIHSKCIYMYTNSQPSTSYKSLIMSSKSTILLGVAMLLSLLLQPSTQQEPSQLELIVTGRTPLDPDTITFRCRNSSTHLDLNVEDGNIKFYLNFTQGDRSGPSDLDEILSPRGLFRRLQFATFVITPQLNGFYSCGTGPGQQSNIVPLIARSLRASNPLNLPKTNYTVQAGAETVTLRCPSEPGKLQNCYYGEWKKGATRLVRVPIPSLGICESSGDIEYENSLKYRLNRKDFSLTIVSPRASTDNGEYTCQLRLYNAFGTTYNFPLGKLNLTVINPTCNAHSSISCSCTCAQQAPCTNTTQLQI